MASVFQSCRLLLAWSASILILSAGLAAQSHDQDFPTPITTSEVNGLIKARDLGDSRLTSYFYAFDGDQGDIFINVVTKNFSGDIDVFTVEGLRPLTKMVIYADAGASETGRLVYLRKPEKLLMRIQGRTPGDDPATFRIKFGGSFVALAGQKVEEAPQLPKTAGDENGVRVNSVGTIIPSVPKPRPPAQKAEQKTEPKAEPKKDTARDRPVAAVETAASKTPPAKTGETTETPKKPAKAPRPKPEVVVTENIPPKVEPGEVKPPVKTDDKTPKKAKPAKPEVPDPMQNVHLVIDLKDGTTIERRMSEVLRVNVDKGILTVIYKDGRISSFSILDVAKVTIQ